MLKFEIILTFFKKTKGLVSTQKAWKNLFALMMVLGVGISGERAHGLILTEFLEQVQARHHGLQSLQVSREATEDRRKAGDLGLAPVLQLKAQSSRDERIPSQTGTTVALATVYSLGFNKKFSTGTSLGVTAQGAQFENQNISPSLASSFGDYVSGGLNFSVSQSLWKDAFGKATYLRQEREMQLSRTEQLAIELQRQKILSDAEKSYWDFIYAREEVELHQANLKRAQRIETWVRRRLADGIADRSDWLNAKALVMNRRLQLLSSEDEYRGAQRLIRTILELAASESLPPLEGNLQKLRSPYAYVLGCTTQKKDCGESQNADGQGAVASLDYLLKRSEADVKKSIASEVEENLKSDLVLAGSYGSNPYEAQGSLTDVFNKLGDFGKPTLVVSLVWTHMLEGEAKSSQRSLARREALGAKLQSERLRLESQAQWKEYLRRHSELTQKILTASEISELQKERTEAEQDKFSKGRSVTQSVINAEQDAAEAELLLAKLRSEQRKLETQSRFFTVLAGPGMGPESSFGDRPGNQNEVIQ